MNSSEPMGKHFYAVNIRSKIHFPTPGVPKVSVGDKKPLICLESEMNLVHLGHLYIIHNPTPSLPSDTLILDFGKLLTRALSQFTEVEGSYPDMYSYDFIPSNFTGVEFIHASATDLKVADLKSPQDVSQAYKQLIPFHPKINYTDQFPPICALQVTQLFDGHFIGCSVSHPLTTYPPFRNFFKEFADDCSQLMQGVKVLDFRRDSIPISKIELCLLNGVTKVAFNPDEPSLEKVFSSIPGFTPGDFKGVRSIPEEEEALLEKVSSSTGESIPKLEDAPPRYLFNININDQF